MRIKDISVQTASYVKPAPKLLRSFAIIKISTQEGEVGYGEASDSYGHSHPLLVKFLTENYLRKLLVGEEVTAVERLVGKLERYTQMYFGLDGLTTQTISGIEIALWDLVGKSLEKPVSALLGGSKESIKLYGTGCTNFGASYEWHAKFFETARKSGINTFKIRIGRDPAWDMELVRNMRETLGDRTTLMVDAYMSYSPPTASKVSEELDKYNIYFFEEPVLSYDMEGLAYVAKRSKVPIAVGEHTYRTFGFKELMDHGAVQIIQPDATICGGLLESISIASLAEARNVTVIPHIGGLSAVGVAANIHLAAAIRHSPMLEFDSDPYQPMKDSIIVDPLFAFDRIKGGYIQVPNSPGLGIELDERALAKLPLREGDLYPDIYPNLGSGSVGSNV